MTTLEFGRINDTLRSGRLAKYLTHVETKFFLENLVSSLNPSALKITI